MAEISVTWISCKINVHHLSLWRTFQYKRKDQTEKGHPAVPERELTCPVCKGWFLLGLQVQTLSCGRRRSVAVLIPLAGFRAQERSTDGKQPAMATKWDLGGGVGVTAAAKLHQWIWKMDRLPTSSFCCFQFLQVLCFGSLCFPGYIVPVQNRQRNAGLWL